MSSKHQLSIFSSMVSVRISKLLVSRALMIELSSIDIALLLLLIVGTIYYFLILQRGEHKRDASGKQKSKRNEPKEKCTILFGSQTGTAEGFARQLGLDLGSYGIEASVQDLSDFQPVRFCSLRAKKFK